MLESQSLGFSESDISGHFKDIGIPIELDCNSGNDDFVKFKVESNITQENVPLYLSINNEGGVESTFNDVIQSQFIYANRTKTETEHFLSIKAFEKLSFRIDFTLNKLSNQVNYPGDNISAIQVVASGGDPNLDFSYTITGQPNGITIDSQSGEISGTIDLSALSGGIDSNGLHLVTVTVSKPGSTDEQSDFTWNITDTAWQVKGEAENYSIRHECSFVQVGDKFALIGGRESADVDIFDYNLGIWNPAVDTAPNVLNHFQAVYYQGYIWAIGAFIGGNSVFPNDPIADNIWLFDALANQWIQGPEIPQARKRGASGLVMYKDKFYLIGGNTLGHNGGFVAWFDEYDPQTGNWITLADAPHARDHFQATLIGDKIYAIGGAQTSQPDNTYVSEVDVYDFTTGTWTTLNNKDLPTPRDGASIAVFNDDIIVMGGGDQDDTVNGEFVKGTREIAEAFDLETETWFKMPDMNFGHRSTQAIVSGNGIHILAGQSSSGNIHGNMEYYGEDNPTGSPIVVSQISVPNTVSVANEGSSSFDLEVLNGETGIFITSMEITGVNANDFSIASGGLTNQLLKSGSSHTVNIALSGVGINRTASLIINYGNSQTAIVDLTNSPLSNPGNQSSFIGDSVALQIEVINDGNSYSFSALDLPEGLSIDSISGLITGTVTGAISNSPYTSRVALTNNANSLEAAFMNFQWEVLNSSIIVIDDIPNQNNVVGDTVQFSAFAEGGNEVFPMVYAIVGEPLGLSIDAATGEISGNIDLSANTGGPNNDGIYQVTVTASRQDATDVTTNFTWTITSGTDVIYRVNAGGPELTFNGNLFSADANFIGGKTFQNTNATVSPLFQTERSASPPTFEYAFSLPNGDYQVILHFAEIYFGANGGGSGGVGSRIFDVEGEGIKLLDDYDIFAEVGAQTEVTKSFLVNVSDGALNLIFDASGSDGADQPKVSAIEILEPSLYPGIVVEAIVDQNNIEGDQIQTFDIVASGGNPDANFTYTLSGEPEGVFIDPITGAINGTISQTASNGGPNSNGIYQVLVTVSKPGSIDSQEQFVWTVTTNSPCIWNDLPDSSLERIEAQSAKVGDKLYVFAGFLAGLQITDTVEIYDTIANTWSTGAAMPVAVTHMGIAVVGTDIWVVSGFVGNHPGTATDLVQIYDTVLNSWSTGPSLPVRRGSGAVAFNNGKIHYFGGLLPDRVTDVGDHYVLDVNNQGLGWISATDLPNPRNHLSAASINGLVYAIGGQYGHDNGVQDQVFLDVYDPSTDTWTRLANLPSPRSHFEPGTIVHNDKIIIVGGRLGESFFYDDVTEYDPISNVWSERCKLPEKLLAPAAKVFGDRLLVANGGVNGISNPTNATRWISIEPDLDQWFDKNEDETYTARHECSFVQAGDKFYLLGGRENAQTLDIYDYTTDSWSSLVNSAPVEFNHFQALEYDGLIWVIGAFKTNNFPLEVPADYIWAFNPATTEWIQGPEIPNNRKRGSAGLVVYDNKFYVLAGNTIGHDGGYVNWFDEYDPATGIWTVLADAPRSRDHFNAAVIDGKLYAASGRLSGGTGGVFAPVISEVDVYDFATQTWSTLPSAQNIPTPRAATIVVNFENKLVVSGGESLASTNAFAITEIFDPVTQLWEVGEPLNHARHGTQGIVSGDGIFVAGGSPNRGGGNQKNMEYYGQDNPVGSASVASMLSADGIVNFVIGETKVISISNTVGNVGTFLESVSITGPDADDFMIDSGNTPFKLIMANATHDIVITHIGNSFEREAILTVTYNNSDSLLIDLRVPFNGLIYNGITWLPYAPDETTVSENALVMSGTFTVSSDMEVHDLNIQSGASLIVEPGNALTTNGDINVDGTGFIELGSSSLSYASLIPKGTVNGNVIYKRHVNNNTVGATGSNDLIAPPLSGQAFNDFSANNSNIVSNSSNTLYLFGPFNKISGSYDTYGASESATLDAGIGYRAASTDTGTFTFAGLVNTGSVPVAISNSGPSFEEWNLIGNPYPSYLNLKTFLTTNIDVFDANSAAIYGYDGNASDGWIVWNQATADSRPDYSITPGQGFFVASQATGGTVNFEPAMREKGVSDDFIAGRSAQSLPSYLKLSLKQNNKTYHTDFYFNPNASRGLDKGYDAEVWGGNASNFSLHSYLVEDNTGLPMAIQSLGETDYDDVQIALGVNANLGEQIRLSISENTLPSTIEVYLEDRLTQTIVPLTTSDYVFIPSISLGIGRFFLSLSDSALSSGRSTFNSIYVFNDSTNKTIIVSGLITETSVAQLYDVQGREVISSTLRLNTSQQNIDVSNLEKGVYIISIKSASDKMTKKLILR